MATVRQLLASKRPDLWTIGPDASIYEALQLMADKDVGAVPVVMDGRLVGIFSERDYARKVVLHGRNSRETLVGELMTAEVVCVRAEQTIEECQALMTNYRVRHLPVIDADGHLTGIVTIGDVVKQIISEHEFTIRHLETYITGSAPSVTS